MTEDVPNRRASKVQKLLSRAAPFLLTLLIPLDWFAILSLVAVELLGRLGRRMHAHEVPEFSPPRPQCSFVLLSWNSQQMLAESLPPLLQELRAQGGDHEVIVLDNHSTDGTDEFVQRRFPEVRFIRSKANVYFGAGNRLGIAAASRDILVLMNSDTIAQPGFLPPLLQVLSDPTVFGAASQVLNSEGQGRETGNTHACFNRSEINWTHESVMEGHSRSPVLWLHRGLFAVDRRKYLWLGGLDSLYDPMYVEDIDLSYRAWKVGWKCVLAADSRVLHKHHIKIPAAGEGFVHMIVRRNQQLFIWKNMNSLSMLFKNALLATGMRLRRAKMPSIGLIREVQSFLAALERLPRVLLRRLAFSCRITISDEQVLELTRSQLIAEGSCQFAERLPCKRD
jgi:GT2 family glycosyltransferase